MFLQLDCKGRDTIGISENKAASNARHVAKLDQIMIKPYKEEGQRIRTAADQAGQSVTAYILQAVRERMEREKV